jgi:hypothetical protein
MINMFTGNKPKYWLDTNCFILPHRGPYRFHWGTNLWDFLAGKARENIIGSPITVLSLELLPSDTSKADELARWALDLKKEGVLFIQPNELVQRCQSKIVQSVSNNKTYKPSEVQKFCAKVDPWIIAYTKTYGGKIVTFETVSPGTRKPKIPDVAKDLYNIVCINLWDALDELGYHA